MMDGIWNVEELSEEQKMQDFEVTVKKIAEQEQFYKMDAEVHLQFNFSTRFREESGTHGALSRVY